jgi:adenosylcobyric acid synthase
MGLTTSRAHLKPVLQKSDGSMDGARSDNGQIWGTYLHGLFDNTAFRQTFLKDLAPDRYSPSAIDGDTPHLFKDRQYNLLADHFEKNLNMETLTKIMWGPQS